MAKDSRVLVAIESLRDVEKTVQPAIDIAKGNGGKIIALYTINVGHTAGAKPDDLYKNIKKTKAEPAMEKVRKMCLDAGVDVITRIKRGPICDVMPAVAKKEKADIVLMRPTSKKSMDDVGRGYGIMRDKVSGTPLLNIDPSGVILALDGSGVGYETEEAAELLNKIIQNTGTFSGLVTKLVALNELIEDSAPIMKGAFDKSLKDLDHLGKEFDPEDAFELVDTFLKNTEVFSNFVKRMVAVDELLTDAEPIMKGAFDGVSATINPDDAASLIDALTKNMGTFASLVEKTAAMNELMEDIQPVMKGAFDKSLVFLDELQGDVDPEEAALLMRKVLQNTSTFSHLMDQLLSMTELMDDATPIIKSAFQKSLIILQEVDQKLDMEAALDLTDTVMGNMRAFSSLAGTAVGVHELMEDVKPITFQAFNKALVKLDELQRSGAIDRMAKMSKSMEMVYNNISDEALERMGMNIILMNELLNRAMKPEVVNMMCGLLDTVALVQNQEPKKMGMFSTMSLVRDPDIQLAIGLMSTFLKNLHSCVISNNVMIDGRSIKEVYEETITEG